MAVLLFLVLSLAYASASSAHEFVHQPNHLFLGSTTTTSPVHNVEAKHVNSSLGPVLPKDNHCPDMYSYEGCCLSHNFMDTCENCLCTGDDARFWCNRNVEPSNGGCNHDAQCEQAIGCFQRLPIGSECEEVVQCQAGLRCEFSSGSTTRTCL